MKNQLLWLALAGAALYLFLKKSASTAANPLNTAGLAPAYQNVINDPNPDNVAALIKASGTAAKDAASFFSQLWPGSKNGGVPATTTPVAQADVASAFAAGQANDANYDPIPDYSSDDLYNYWGN